MDSITLKAKKKIDKISDRRKIKLNIFISCIVIAVTPPEIEIDQPKDVEMVATDVSTVSGTIEDTNRNITVLVNEATAVVSGEGAVFNPYVIIDLPCNTSKKPLVYRYNTTWDSLGSKVSGARISTSQLTQFSVYAVFIPAFEAVPTITLILIIALMTFRKCNT